jgi:hypothetical protein
VGGPESPFSFGDAIRRAREKSLIDGLIGDVIRAGAKGKTREQIRDLYVEQLRLYGRDIPPAPIIDFHVSAILAKESRQGRIELNRDGFRVGRELISHFANLVTKIARHDWPDVDPDDLPMPGDPKRTAEVTLDASTQEWIGRAPPLVTEFRGLSMIEVRIEAGDDDAVVVSTLDKRLGAVVGEPAAEIRDLLGLLRDQRSLRGHGTRVPDHEGTWHVYLHLPSREFVERLRDFPRPDTREA